MNTSPPALTTELDELNAPAVEATIAAIVSGRSGARRLGDCWPHPDPQPPKSERPAPPPDDPRAGWYPIERGGYKPPMYHFVTRWEKWPGFVTACGHRDFDFRRLAPAPLRVGEVITGFACQTCRGRRPGLRDTHANEH